MTLSSIMNHFRATRRTSVHSGTAPWIGKGLSLVERHWKLLATVYSVIVLGVIVSCGITIAIERPFDLAKRSWGGFDERPTTAKCYRQERTAMLLAFFLGSFGIDQFYAHHWPLAVFKLLTLGAGGIWWFVDIVLWMVGGVYGTPGCPGGSEHSWQY